MEIDAQAVVKKSEFGATWPFKVDEVLVRRHKKRRAYTPVTVVVGNRVYGLNGAADMLIKTWPLENIWKIVNPGPPRTYVPIDPILDFAFSPGFGKTGGGHDE